MNISCNNFLVERLFPLAIVFAACGVCGLPNLANAHDGDHDHDHGVAAVKPAEMYAPSAMPDRIVLCLTTDPRTSQAVNWRTSTEVKVGLVQIAVADSGPKFVDSAKQFTARTELLKTDINEAHFHSFTFTGLIPGTKYAYRVGDGTNWSEWFQFDTATAEQRPFSFIYFGDAQNNLRSMWSRVIREAYRDAPRAAFLLHAGDLVNGAESDAEWGEWFGSGGWLNGTTPSIAIPGNHEQAKNADGTRHLSHHWRPQFTFPENGPPGLEETCYTLVYQNVRFIGLNSNSKQDVQTEWLADVLAENTSRWVVCTFHHPIFSTGKERDNAELRAIWKPIFDKYRVDLVLQGHDHTYGRTGMDVPDTLENVPTGLQHNDQKTGTVYVVSVSGPKMYNNSRHPFMKRLAEDTQLYQIIHVDGDRLTFEARTATGDLYDSFQLRKRNEQINQLIEIEPEVPQRLRPQSDQ